MHRSYLENYAQIIYKVKAERSLGVDSVFSRLDSLSTVSNQSVPYQRVQCIYLRKGGSVLSKYVVYFESYRVSEWSCQITFGLVMESGRVSCREGKFPAWINLIGFVCHDHVGSMTYGSCACISCGLRARRSHKLYTRKSNTDKISRRPNETNPQRVVDSISFSR